MQGNGKLGVWVSVRVREASSGILSEVLRCVYTHARERLRKTTGCTCVCKQGYAMCCCESGRKGLEKDARASSRQHGNRDSLVQLHIHVYMHMQVYKSMWQAARTLQCSSGIVYVSVKVRQCICETVQTLQYNVSTYIQVWVGGWQSATILWV